VSLIGFQRALAELCSAPELGPRIVHDPHATLAGFELDGRELGRLAAMAADPGMATNWTLYRANRLTPLNRILPITLGVLGAELRPVVNRFWRSRAASLQSAGEAESFARFLRQQLAEGTIVDPILAEVVDFELAVSELRFLSRKQAAALVEHESGAGHDGPEIPEGLLIRHPLIRVVRFRHDPDLVFGRIAEGGAAGCSFPEEEHFLVLDWRAEDLRLCDLGARLGAFLETFGSEARCAAGEQAAALRRAGYLVVPRRVRSFQASPCASRHRPNPGRVG
jgi:hypothetical protein